MTQYDEIVNKQAHKLELEEWAKGLKQLYAHDGIIETWYNNGDIHYEENKPNGKKWMVYAELKESEIENKFDKYQADMTIKERE